MSHPFDAQAAQGSLLKSAVSIAPSKPEPEAENTADGTLMCCL
jgi:hypothetical protein